MMFANVYYHKTRLIVEHHYHEAVSELMENGDIEIPAPGTKEDVERYFRLDDMTVWQKIRSLTYERVTGRNHYRMIDETRLKTEQEVEPTRQRLTRWASELEKKYRIRAVPIVQRTQLMKLPKYSIPVRGSDGFKTGNLLECSWLATALSTNIVGVGQLFVDSAQREEAIKAIRDLSKQKRRLRT
jgi:HD superfamily phosphohydrolase